MTTLALQYVLNKTDKRRRATLLTGTFGQAVDKLDTKYLQLGENQGATIQVTQQCFLVCQSEVTIDLVMNSSSLLNVPVRGLFSMQGQFSLTVTNKLTGANYKGPVEVQVVYA